MKYGISIINICYVSKSTYMLIYTDECILSATQSVYVYIYEYREKIHRIYRLHTSTEGMLRVEVFEYVFHSELKSCDIYTTIASAQNIMRNSLTGCNHCFNYSFFLICFLFCSFSTGY